MIKWNFKQKSPIIKHPGNLVQKQSPYSTKPRIIGVTSGKGGVGKTSLTVNLAISLSQAGRKVVVFDADLGMANAEILLGISPPLSLYDCLKGRAGIEDILIPGPGGIKLVSGGSGFIEMANLNDKILQKLMDSLDIFDHEADFIIVDTAAGISRNVLAFVAAVQELILVITPEPTSMTDAYSLAKIVSNNNLHANINIIINRAANSREATETLNRFNNVCKSFLSISINYLGYIPEDKSIPAAIKAQEPLVLYNNLSQAAKCIHNISHDLDNHCQKNDKQKNLGIKDFASKFVRLFRR